MAQQWTAKASGEVIQREWTIPVDDGDSVQSFTAAASGATINASERSGETVTLTISAGTNGETGVFTLTASTTKGLTLNETYYLPIRDKPNAFSYTIRDVVEFALRPITGLGVTPTAAELDDGQEHLDDMLAEWAGSGADLGVKLSSNANDILYVPDGAISAIKNNLKVRVCGQYGKAPDRETQLAAIRGLQQVKTSLLPDERESVFY